MKDRIKQLRNKMGLTQAEFANKINISRSHLSGLENGTRSFTERIICDVCREFDVNREWLENGHGEMHSDILKELDIYDEDLKEFINIYRELDEDAKKYFKEIMIKTIRK